MGCCVYLVFGILLFVHLNDGSIADTNWNKYKVEFKKQYSTAKEEQFRKEIFEKHVEIIKNHNMKYYLGLKTFKLGLNEYADLTNYEFRKLLNKLVKIQTPSNKKIDKELKKNLKQMKLPDNVDWRDKGFVSPVKNQGQCGSAIAYSITGTIESVNAVKVGVLTPLSLPQVIDCCAGCSGSAMSDTFECIINMKGVDSESCYVTKSCTYNKTCNGVAVNGYSTVRNGYESGLQEAVAVSGPVSVAIDASNLSFQLYKDGIYDEPRCSSSLLDHSVLVVGYGDDGKGHDYWLAQNSWGTSWGIEGYIKMSRNKSNQCGIASLAYYPVL